MKILHTADIHLGDLTGPVRDGKNARRQDTIACMKYIAQRAATCLLYTSPSPRDTR